MKVLPIWTGSAALGGFRATSKHKLVVDMCYLHTCNKQNWDPTLSATKDAIRSLDLYCDISQNVSSCQCSTQHILGTTTSSNIYSFQLDRLLMPEEMMMVYGWPRRIAEARTKMPEVTMPDLAGHTMALQPLATVILAIMITFLSCEAQRLPSTIAGKENP